MAGNHDFNYPSGASGYQGKLPYYLECHVISRTTNYRKYRGGDTTAQRSGPLNDTKGRSLADTGRRRAEGRLASESSGIIWRLKTINCLLSSVTPTYSLHLRVLLVILHDSLGCQCVPSISFEGVSRSGRLLPIPMCAIRFTSAMDVRSESGYSSQC